MSEEKLREVGLRITEARNRKNISRKRLSVLIGSDEKTVKKWEDGMISPRVDDLYRMAEVLDCSAEFFLTSHTGEKTGTGSGQPAGEPEEVQRKLERIEVLLSSCIYLALIGLSFVWVWTGPVFLIASLFCIPKKLHQTAVWLLRIATAGFLIYQIWYIAQMIF